MPFIIRGFLLTAVLYGAVGIGLGLMMAISQDHGQVATHAHVNLIGWVSFALFAVYYKTFGQDTALSLARAHFWLAQVSVIVMFISLAMMFAGNMAVEPFAAISSIAYAVSFLIFIINVFKNS